MDICCIHTLERYSSGEENGLLNRQDVSCVTQVRILLVPLQDIRLKRTYKFVAKTHRFAYGSSQLPGDIQDKVGSFFEPLTQQLNGGEFELESLKQRGILDVNSPFFMRGTT